MAAVFLVYIYNFLDHPGMSHFYDINCTKKMWDSMHHVCHHLATKVVFVGKLLAMGMLTKPLSYCIT